MREFPSRGPRLGLIRLTVVLAVAGLLGSVGVSSPRAGVTDPTLVWGIAGLKDKTSVTNLEGRVGRRFGAVRVFLSWNEVFPTSYHSWLASTGRTPLISVKASRVDGTTVIWRDIANAQPGTTMYSQIAGWADKIKAYGVPVYFTFNHEPEAKASSRNGTASEYILAWRKVYTIFQARGVTNAKFHWIMTANAFRVSSTDSRYAPKWYPGDAYVQALGTDVYNDYTCRGTSSSPWMALSYEIEKFRMFAAAHPAKEMWLAEWASAEDPDDPTRKARWLDQVRADLKDRSRYPQLRGLLYFSKNRPGTPCEWYVDSTSDSMSAFIGMGKDVYYTSSTGG